MASNLNLYDGTKLLSLKDINGETPEVFLVTTNRSGGKTTFFSRMLINRFKEKSKKFMLLYRFNYELDEVCDKFFKDIKRLFFQNDEMTDKVRAKGKYHELFLNDVPCGYACAINDADVLKKYSHLFSDTEAMFFDEFMSESNHYCNDEVNKFYSLHFSVARGGGKVARYLPVYMCGNTVTLLNPYYIALDVAHRVTNNAKFIRGDGFVLEQGFVKYASDMQKESGFNRAFARCRYADYGMEGAYLNDNSAFVGRMTGKSRYICTLKFDGKEYGIRQFVEDRVVYIDKTPDLTNPNKIVSNSNDHQVDYLLVDRGNVFIATLRAKYQCGMFRFKDLECKRAAMVTLSYME